MSQTLKRFFPGRTRPSQRRTWASQRRAWPSHQRALPQTVALVLPFLTLLVLPRLDARPHDAAQTAATGGQKVNLADLFTGAKLRAVNREVTILDNPPGAIHVSAKPGNGIVWIPDIDFTDGTIEVDIRGKDVLQQSFVGIAFHGKDDQTYEAVYLRPFNFRAQDPVRRGHAVQYIAPPEFDWPQLREKFPEEFEHGVDQSIVPTDWVPLRVVVNGPKIEAYVGRATSPALSVREMGKHHRGTIGLWVGNNSEGDFANLRVAYTK